MFKCAQRIRVFLDTRIVSAPNCGDLSSTYLLPLDKNLEFSKELLQRCKKNELWLKIEIGIIGAQNEGAAAASLPPNMLGDKKMFTSGYDFLAVYEAFKNFTREWYLVAPAFGNSHGVYKPGELSRDTNLAAGAPSMML